MMFHKVTNFECRNSTEKFYVGPVSLDLSDQFSDSVKYWSARSKVCSWTKEGTYPLLSCVEAVTSQPSARGLVTIQVAAREAPQFSLQYIARQLGRKWWFRSGGEIIQMASYFPGVRISPCCARLTTFSGAIRRSHLHMMWKSNRIS